MTLCADEFKLFMGSLKTGAWSIIPNSVASAYMWDGC